MNRQVVSEKEFIQLLASLSNYLDADSVAEFSDIELGQWELPFEAVILELVKKERDQIYVDEALITALAEESGIISDGGVIDPESWDKFKQWISPLPKLP